MCWISRVLKDNKEADNSNFNRRETIGGGDSLLDNNFSEIKLH